MWASREGEGVEGKYGRWMGEAEGWDCCREGRPWWVEAWEVKVEGGSEGKCGEEEGLRELRCGWRELGGRGGEYGWWMGEAEGWDCCIVEGGWKHGRGREGKCEEEWRGGMRERRRC